MKKGTCYKLNTNYFNFINNSLQINEFIEDFKNGCDKDFLSNKYGFNLKFDTENYIEHHYTSLYRYVKPYFELREFNKIMNQYFPKKKSVDITINNDLYESVVENWNIINEFINVLNIFKDVIEYNGVNYSLKKEYINKYYEIKMLQYKQQLVSSINAKVDSKLQIITSGKGRCYIALDCMPNTFTLAEYTNCYIKHGGTFTGGHTSLYDLVKKKYISRIKNKTYRKNEIN